MPRRNVRREKLSRAASRATFITAPRAAHPPPIFFSSAATAAAQHTTFASRQCCYVSSKCCASHCQYLGSQIFLHLRFTLRVYDYLYTVYSVECTVYCAVCTFASSVVCRFWYRHRHRRIVSESLSLSRYPLDLRTRIRTRSVTVTVLFIASKCAQKAFPNDISFVSFLLSFVRSFVRLVVLVVLVVWSVVDKFQFPSAFRRVAAIIVRLSYHRRRVQFFGIFAANVTHSLASRDLSFSRLKKIRVFRA